MISFLHRLTDEILEKYGDDLSGLCLVFPSRRAGLFFTKEFSTRISKPVWSPATFAIQDFFALFYPQTIPDPLTLRFELYDVYKKYFPEESFDRFYPWGELLLRDFDDLDKYMVNARKVFSTIHDMHEIDREFDLPDEELERLKIFWENFFEKDVSRLKSEFINTWKNLGSIYADFRESLKEKNLVYEGMAYRQVAENWTGDTFAKLDGYNKIIFVGLYALSKAEEQIISRIKESGKAEIFWDADTYYTDDPAQDAGVFLRNNLLAGKTFNWKENYLGAEEKEIEIAGIPLQVGQAKYAGHLVQEWMKEKDFKPEKAVLVLPDENLLFPVLYALPESLEDINVTMGYPMHATPLFRLFESLISLCKNSRKEKDGSTSYYFRDVLDVVQHSFIRQIHSESIRSWMHRYSKQRTIRISQEELLEGTDPELFPLLFNTPDGLPELFNWFLRILRLILESMKEQEFRFHRLESEFVYQFYTELKRFEELVIGRDLVAGLDTFWKLFREIIYSSKIPFTGEPLKGLQVMGFLETRILDFDHVIILSVNEDLLPASGNKPSFIPYNLRKAFGLPTYEDQHAVSAYHFYRLLQRAKDVHLLYNTEPGSLSPGEKSRFLLQVEHELVPAFRDKIHLTEKVISTSFREELVQPIVIPKSESVMKILSRYIIPDEKSETTVKRISASALITYISCSLKFYFRYIAGLSEAEETEETMEAATFGKVLHKTMQLLYKDEIEITEPVINSLLSKLDDTLEAAIREEFPSTRVIEGKNLLLKNVIRELARKILETDRRDVPFRIRLLEKNLEREFTFNGNRRVMIHGIIDRVDETDGAVRVVDYKTGKVDPRKNPDLSDYFTNPKLKEQFQAFLYAGFVRPVFQNKPVKSGLILLRNLSGGVWYLNEGNPFSSEQFSEFDLHAGKLLTELFNPVIPFIQTEDSDRCIYCEFKNICSR